MSAIALAGVDRGDHFDSSCFWLGAALRASSRNSAAAFHRLANDRVRRLVLETWYETTDGPVTPATGAQTVQEAIAPKLSELQALGWRVELTTDVATLHASFKNGKPRKSPSVSLSFDEYTVDFFIDIGDEGEWVGAELV